MLALSRLDGVPVYEDDTTQVLTSYSRARLVREIPDQGRSWRSAAYSIGLLIELMMRERGEWGNGTGFNILDLYEKRGNAPLPTLGYREAFELMMTEGYRIGPATYYLQGFFRIPDAEQLRLYLVTQGPVLLALPVYDTPHFDFWNFEDGEWVGYHGICAVGYNSRGIELVNTCGPTWGDNGRAVLPWGHFSLIREIWGLKL